ncbi:hypothetical protein MRB53_035012 [Persea americana]|uniref:Uncharacterized protein n=1 Tax=Persea americana TaxID=3435 RepID=A0ACC2K3G8_PERAE|nr:hypothetical protein MRB53_035012 [Persea americana]
MRREGRQHGMVRNYMVLPPPSYQRPKSKVVNEFTPTPTADINTKVPTKLTNHYKFTGCCRKSRCPGCHSRPACKPKDKTKGTHKLKSYDVTLNHRLIEWRVVDKGLGLDFDEVGGQMDGDLDHVTDDPITAMVDEEVNPGGTKIDGDDKDLHEVGLVLDFVDDCEDWCLVGKM